MKRIAILGSTGSIGRSTLDVIEKNPDRFELLTMAAGIELRIRAGAGAPLEAESAFSRLRAGR